MPLLSSHKDIILPKYSSGQIIVALIHGSEIDLIFITSGISAGLCNSKEELSFKYIENGNGNSIERLYEWPNNIPCEVNFGSKYVFFLESKNISSLSEINFYYLLSRKMLLTLNISIDKDLSPNYFAKINFKV